MQDFTSLKVADTGTINESADFFRKDPTCDTVIVANQGKTATFMQAWPQITTFTLVKGWKQDTTSKLKEAVNEVVRCNPILTGTASRSGGFLNTKISITPGKYLADSHDFVHEIETDAMTENLQKMNETEVLHFMDEFLAPIVSPAEFVIESIESGGPLFGIDVIKLPHDYACYVVRMSHCVGDGSTYYHIMEEINRALNHKASHPKAHAPLVWSHPAIASHEVFPERFSPRDTEISYGVPVFLGLLKNYATMKERKKAYIIIDKHKVEQKRKELAIAGNGYLSANDIITSALCGANLSSEIFAFTMNMRDRHDHFGGNFHSEIPFFKKSAVDPNAFRSIVKKGFYYDTNKIPICPFIRGQVGRISNVATVQKLITADGMEVVCHSMLSSFVQNVPLDTAFIISMNADSYVVLHNFREIDLEDSSLNAILCHH